MKKAVICSYEVIDMMVKRKVEVVDAPDEDGVLDFLYSTIGCTSVDVAYLPNGVLAWVSDTGLIESGNVVCEYDGAPLAGTVVFSLSETAEEGNTQWFDDVDVIEKIIDVAEQSELKGIVR